MVSDGAACAVQSEVLRSSDAHALFSFSLCFRGEKCDGCTEKGDFLRLIKSVLPKQIAAQQARKAPKGADKKDL